MSARAFLAFSAVCVVVLALLFMVEHLLAVQSTCAVGR